MPAISGLTWGSRLGERPSAVRRADAAIRVGAAVAMAATTLGPWIAEAVDAPDVPATRARAETTGADTPQRSRAREILLSFYMAQPFYYRSDVHLKQPGGTDMVLKRLGWDGDMIMPPIDGGIRSVEWWGSGGFMIDFLHNKAVARLGKGAHGRRISNPVIEEVETAGTLAGKPAPARLKLTDMFERLEFTHGQNMLLFTPMLRTGSPSPRIRPYLGVGAGFALPHVEVWFNGANRDDRTNEYQLAGPAAQAVAGIELRTGKISYFLEYKFSMAWIGGALTGDESWMNFNMPGDLLRQLGRWWRGDEPKHGRFSTRLGAHQIAGGFGYWWQRPARAR